MLPATVILASRSNPIHLRARDPYWILTLLAVGGALAVTLILTGTRLFVPSEQAVIRSENWVWTHDGVTIEPIDPIDPIDPVNAVDPVEALAAFARHLGASRSRHGPPMRSGSRGSLVPRRPKPRQAFAIRFVSTSDEAAAWSASTPPSSPYTSTAQAEHPSASSSSGSGSSRWHCCS